MKTLALLFSLAILSLGVTGQDTDKMNSKTQTQTGTHSGKDHVMMKDGKMMVMKGGKSSTMDKEMTMSNGTKVMTDGTVIKKDGSKMTLKEGDHVYMDGTVKVKMNDDKSKKDSK
jgi:hypothetical protein